ncbi:hypothetical protein [Scandinavium goeteborgense]|uniref:hypothetical protein n=1 Tax=Scandinavium goeteborgense TaxID=1851514 RepID=UPI001FE7B7EE|nr:hypothetical protein [Scandinavium goeteborgense]
MINELVRLGLMVYKSKEEGPTFDLEGYRRNLFKKVDGTREGMIIHTTLISEMYLKYLGREALNRLEELVHQNLESINNAETEAEN